MEKNPTYEQVLRSLLIEKETMDGDEFKSIVAEFTSVPEKDRTVPILN